MLMPRPRMTLSLSVALMLSCQERNPAYCMWHPEEAGCGVDQEIPPAMCTNDTECVKPTPVCDTTSSMCVECTSSDPGSCAAATPICGADDRCHGCVADADCASNTCLPDGACAPALEVLYAATEGSPAANCMPEAKCSLVRAIELIDGTKVTIRLDPGSYDLEATLALGISMRIVGRGAVINRDQRGTGPTLLIGDGAVIALDYVSIEGGDGAAVGVGIGCTGATLIGRNITVQGNDATGISAVGCDLTLTQARIVTSQGIGIAASGGTLRLTRSLVFGHPNGGVVITGAEFVLENDFIVQNGGPFSLFGGLLITQISPGGEHVFDFNTVAYNAAAPEMTPGVVCSVVGTPLTLTNSIVFANGGGLQVEGSNCSWSYSDISPIAVAGRGNRSTDPQFVDPARSDFHLRSTSPVRDLADPTATLAVDHDGDRRPQGGGPDIGADEVREAQ
jgi:hypothetical protein